MSAIGLGCVDVLNSVDVLDHSVVMSADVGLEDGLELLAQGQILRELLFYEFLLKIEYKVEQNEKWRSVVGKLQVVEDE